MFTLPHACKYPLIVFATLLTLFAPPAAAARRAGDAALQKAAPSGEVEAGVRLFQQGDYKGAVKLLRSALKKKGRADERRALLYLGHALVGREDMKKARKVFHRLVESYPDYAPGRAGFAYFLMATGDRRDAEREAARALELDKTSVDAHYVLGLIRLNEGAWLKVIEEADAIIKLDPRAANAYYLKSQAAYGLYQKAGAVISEQGRGAYPYTPETLAAARESQPLRLAEAADNLEKYLRLNPSAPDADIHREHIETMRAYARTGLGPEDLRRIFTPTEVTTKAVISSKPDPGYSVEARMNGVRGVVRLRAVLAADGTVRYIFVIRGLPHGLTERAMRAARGIRFKPATFNGVPVSQHVTLEYNFNIY